MPYEADATVAAESQTAACSRRDMLKRAALLITAGATSKTVIGAEQNDRRTGLGLVIYDCALRRKAMQQQNPEFDLFDPLVFLKHCRSLGAGGMQAKLSDLKPAGVTQLREYAEQHGLFIDGIVSPPQDEADVPRFSAEIATAAAAGVQAVRTVIMPGRRYEQFGSLDEFREAERRGRRMAELAAPVMEQHRIPLAIENHKDQRNDERLALLKHIGSEFVGVCLDTGNSFALLEDPIETVELFAPWAKSVHLKDQAVQPHAEGFLLGDIPLGQGCFDLPRMVDIIRRAQPEVRFSLELLTRDALRVTCLTDRYWATMPQVSGHDLARTLRMVGEHRADALQDVARLTLAEQVALEDANVRSSLQYARDVLRL